MRWTRIFKHRMHSLVNRSRAEADLEREFEIHIEVLTRQYVAAGMDPAEALRAASSEFGPLEQTKEQCRDMRRVGLLEDLGKDLVCAFRKFRSSPGFALTAALSLAMGIGANTTVFSVLNALILKPLPVASPERVYFMNNSGQSSNSFPNYREIRDRNVAFESLFSYRIIDIALDNDNAAARVWGYLVTGNYWNSLGIHPALGRFFTPAEDVHADASPYAVLSYSCWQNRFGGDRSIPGKEIRINGRPYTVLGVAPPGFHGTESFYWADVWVPMSMQGQIEGRSWLDNPFDFNAWIAGRLKPGITPEQAEASLQPVAADLARERTVNEGMRLTLSPPGLAGSVLRNPTRAFAGGVMLLAVLVLLAACLNLAALLTARAVDREREMAIRVSIGAGRGRLVRQLLTESIALSLLGGLAGCGVAVVLLGLLSRWRAPLDFPVQFDVNPDWRVFLFTFAIAVATGILFGVGPARRAWRADPALSLKGLGAPVSGRRWSGRDLLLPVQIALCCVLVVSSLVALRGLMRSFRTPLGFTPEHVAVVGYDTGLGGYDEKRGRVFEERALQEIARLPGVETAAYSSSVPLSIDQSHISVYRENERDFRPKNSFHTSYYRVSPGYFRAVGTRLLSGREFTSQDTETSTKVAIVNQTLARRVVGTMDAVGRRFRFGNDTAFEIVGVAEDGKYETLTETPQPAVFFPIQQQFSSTIVLMARSSRPEAELAAEMRQAIARLDPHLAVFGVGGLRPMLGLVFLPMHAAVITLGAFGVLALMLSLTGVYGLSAYTVSRRSREIGIRMAIGARPRQVLRFLFWRLGTLVGAGALTGLVLGIAGAGVLASIVYQASSRDPVVIGATVLAIAVVAMAAAFGPARRAMRVDPVRALRHD